MRLAYSREFATLCIVHCRTCAGTPGLTYTVEAWNWANAGYEVIGEQLEQFNSDQIASFDLTAGSVDSDGSVRTRVGWRQTGFTINFPWVVSIDQVTWE